MSRLARFLLAALLFVTLVPAAYGQQFPMLHYTMTEGLPSNKIYQVFRDSKGYIWIGTDRGVSRYNGVKFETFTTFNGLADNEIFFFVEDLYRRIWFGTFNGALCYYYNDSFHTDKNTPFLKLPVQSPHINYIALAQDSSVTINFYNRRLWINVMDNKCNVYQKDSLRDRTGHYTIIYNRKCPDGNYEVTYASDTTGILSHDIIIDTLGNIQRAMDTKLFYGAKPILNQNKTFFIDSVFVYSEDKKVLDTVKKNVSDNNFMYSYYNDGVNHFFCTRGGLYINDSVLILKNGNVSSITQDKEGNYWIATLDNGIYCLRKDFINTAFYEDIYTGEVRYCYADADHKFFTTLDNNLYTLRDKKAVCLFDYKKYKKKPYGLTNEPGFLIDTAYNYYNVYNDDFIMIKDVRSRAFSVKRFDNYFYFHSVKEMLSTGDYIYIRNRDRISRIDCRLLDKGTYRFDDVINPASEQRFFSLEKNDNNEVWCSSINTIYKVQNGHGVPQLKFKKAFKSFTFFGRYMIGYTHDNQLLICSDIDSNVKVDSIPAQNCIWNNFYRLDATHILISTDNFYRLLTIQPQNKTQPYSIFAIEDPFVPCDAEGICSDGLKCYFFKNGSVTIMDISSLLAKPPVPALYFTFLKTGKNIYRIDSNLQIPFDESKNITVLFSTLSTYAKDIFYQYSVSRTEQDSWQDLTGENINLINTGYGKYTIKIRAKSISSDYCPSIVFTLRISAPFWASWWFIILILLAIAGITIAAIRYRIAFLMRRSKKEHQTEIKFMKSEYKALNALMNPHFIFNTLNNVQSLFNENDKAAANTYLRVFADLIRQNMNNISKELITLQKEIDLVTNYLRLEKLRFEDKLNYNINIDDTLDLSDILVPPLLIQPIVENSIKHGILPLGSMEGLIQINIYEKAGILYIEVKDNGVGMDHSKKDQEGYESYGLSNIKKRIEQLSIIQNKELFFEIRDIKDESGKTIGTAATITMPFSE